MWHVIYKIYPPVLRVLEKLKVHNYRQPYLIATKENIDIERLRNHLEKEGYEDVILAWKDPGEVLGMRKVDEEKFQYHIRLFEDGEIRGHYEYSSEGNPIGHIFERHFEERPEYFRALLRDFI